jgi:hypothetical protein
VPIEGDSISYRTGACFGACPVFSVTVRPDGSGTFTGERFTAATGEHRFRLSAAEYEAFAARLAPARPESGAVRYAPDNKALCPLWATDHPSVEVTWTRAIGDAQSLYFYYGCRSPETEAVGKAVGNATDAIPALAALIGERP